MKWQLMNFLSQNDEKRQQKIIYQYNSPYNAWRFSIEESRYREKDDTLIFVIKEDSKVVIIVNSSKLSDISLLNRNRNITAVIDVTIIHSSNFNLNLIE